MRIPERFTDEELSCPDCGKLPDIRSIEMLYAMRLIMDVPLIINSGARCPEYNEGVGGSKNSAHLIGAFDIQAIPEKEYEMIRVAQAVGFTGIGFKDNSFLHVDRHHDKQVWGY